MVFVVDEDAGTIQCFSDRDYQLNLRPNWAVLGFNTDAPIFHNEWAQPEDNRLYSCLWYAGGYDPTHEEHDFAYFNCERGFSCEDVFELNALSVGEAWNEHAPYQGLRVVRIQ